jgi:SAM-dependent methyltransferase
MKEMTMADQTPIEFTRRTACPSCDSADLKTMWSGRFSDPSVNDMMRLFHYNADVSQALGDQEFDLVRCQDCNFNFHRIVMNDAAIPMVYGDWTDKGQVARFEAEHGSGSRFDDGVRRVKLILRLRHLLMPHFPEPLRLLDFGCGNGETLAQARMLGFHAQGIDVSVSRTEQAERLGNRVFCNLDDFSNGGGGKVHAVILEQVLEHVMAPLEVLRGVAEQMASGGVLFLAVPNCAGITTPANFTDFHKVQPVEHVNAFTPDSLRDIAGRAGFQVIRRPPTYVTTRPIAAARATGGLVWQPPSTEQFFKRA